MDRMPSVFEVQAGEGGEDSKLFVEDLTRAYIKYAGLNGLKVEILTLVHGKSSLKIEGSNIKIFENEGGKHTIQRVPPTERNGRRQTSIVTVSITPIFKDSKNFKLLPENEVEFTTTTSGGPGGQNRNKVESAVRAKHKETGLTVFICNNRDQHKNKREAWSILSSRVKQLKEDIKHGIYRDNKRSQVGDGGRADKIRTYNFIDCRAVDHRTGKKTSKVEEIIYKGRFDLIK